MGGLTYENGITDYIAMESSLRRVILKNTQKVVALADYSKCGVTAMNAVCDVGRIDVLITDKKADKSLLSKLKTSRCV